MMQLGIKAAGQFIADVIIFAILESMKFAIENVFKAIFALLQHVAGMVWTYDGTRFDLRMFGYSLEVSIQIVSRSLKLLANGTLIFSWNPFGTETLGLSDFAVYMTMVFSLIHVALTGTIIAESAQGIYGWVGYAGFFAMTTAYLVMMIGIMAALFGQMNMIFVEEANQIFAMYTAILLNAVLITELFKLFTGSINLRNLITMFLIQGITGGVFFLPQEGLDPVLQGMFWMQMAWVVLVAISAVNSGQIEGLNGAYWLAAGVFAILYLLTGGKFKLFKQLGG